MQQAFDKVDVAIVGGGLVGSSLACALSGSGLRVALIEPDSGAAGASGPVSAPTMPGDQRSLALAQASCNALQALGVWRHLGSAPTPIERIHVSSRGDFGRVLLSALERGLPAFGAVVPARDLGAALGARLAECSGLERIAEGVRHARRDPSGWRLELASGTPLPARLLVAADGANSLLRDSRQIAAQRHDYGQNLFAAVVEVERPHLNTAYERFTDEGPVALLPMPGGRMGSVLTVASSRAAQLRDCDDEAYLDELQQRFGWRLGRIRRLGQRRDYPLARVAAERLVDDAFVLIGNAAQALHPIGAQGFNLGLRDALALSQRLIAAQRCGEDPASPALLQDYAASRQQDRDATLDFSDGLARLFSRAGTPGRWLRSAGLLALAHLPGLDRELVRGAMGLRPGAPLLSRARAS